MIENHGPDSPLTLVEPVETFPGAAQEEDYPSPTYAGAGAAQGFLPRDEWQAASYIGFIPAPHTIVVYFPPKDIRRTAGGIHLDMVDSLDASLPMRGVVVAHGEFSGPYQLDVEVLAKRYVGTQIVVEGDDNFWVYDTNSSHILGYYPEVADVDLDALARAGRVSTDAEENGTN